MNTPLIPYSLIVNSDSLFFFLIQKFIESPHYLWIKTFNVLLFPSEHRHSGIGCINKHTFTPVINFKSGITGWAGPRSRIAHDVRMSADGADHKVLFQRRYR